MIVNAEETAICQQFKRRGRANLLSVAHVFLGAIWSKPLGPQSRSNVIYLGDEKLDAVITEELQRQLAAGVTTVRDLGDLRYVV
jgi:hypothetical protein